MPPLLLPPLVAAAVVASACVALGAAAADAPSLLSALSRSASSRQQLLPAELRAAADALDGNVAVVALGEGEVWIKHLRHSFGIRCERERGGAGRADGRGGARRAGPRAALPPRRQLTPQLGYTANRRERDGWWALGLYAAWVSGEGVEADWALAGGLQASFETPLYSTLSFEDGWIDFERPAPRPPAAAWCRARCASTVSVRPDEACGERTEPRLVAEAFDWFGRVGANLPPFAAFRSDALRRAKEAEANGGRDSRLYWRGSAMQGRGEAGGGSAIRRAAARCSSKRLRMDAWDLHTHRTDRTNSAAACVHAENNAASCWGEDAGHGALGGGFAPHAGHSRLLYLPGFSCSTALKLIAAHNATLVMVEGDPMESELSRRLQPGVHYHAARIPGAFRAGGLNTSDAKEAASVCDGLDETVARLDADPAYEEKLRANLFELIHGEALSLDSVLNSMRAALRPLPLGAGEVVNRQALASAGFHRLSCDYLRTNHRAIAGFIAKQSVEWWPHLEECGWWGHAHNTKVEWTF